jgi:hypothetical protein
MPTSWQASSTIPHTFTDGTSNTILLTEKYGLCGPGGSLWGHTVTDFWQPVFAAWSKAPFQPRPAPEECDPRRASTPFPAIQVALADASVRSVAATIRQETWWAACTPDGGEVLGNDW